MVSGAAIVVKRLAEKMVERGNDVLVILGIFMFTKDKGGPEYYSPGMLMGGR